MALLKLPDVMKRRKIEKQMSVTTDRKILKLLKDSLKTDDEVRD